MTEIDQTEFDVVHYIDEQQQDCYRICHKPSGICSIVSSAHLIEERKIQILRNIPVHIIK